MRALSTPTSNRRGFTIIEVVLVLAIAGLIFLMVFIALPNMQAAQRNTQRRNDYNSIATQVTNYATNHNGSFPAAADVKSQWANSKGEDPDGNAYNIAIVTALTAPDKTNQVKLWKKSICGTDGKPTATGANPKDFTVYGYIEVAGSATGETYCLQSHI